MKIKQGIPTWFPKYRLPNNPPINIIFERTDVRKSKFTNTALLYQDILKYAIDYTDGFTFTEAGNWLVDNNYEFRTYYVGNKARTPKSARLSNRRQTIQACINNLIKMELLYIKSTTKAQKNYSIISLYDLTTYGQFLAWIIAAKDSNKSFDLNWMINDGNSNNTKSNQDKIIGEKRLKAISKVFEIVDSYCKCKDSCNLFFLSKFFRKCMDSGVFGNIVDWFYYLHLQHTEVNKGQELLRLFTKITHPLNWIYTYPEIFTRIVDEETDERAKKLLLYEFKMEIEEYYNMYYLVSYAERYTYKRYDMEQSESYDPKLAISGIEWQLMRFKNRRMYKDVVVPGVCYNCKVECPFILDVRSYLNHLVNIGKTDIIRSSCTKCRTKGSVIGKLYIALDMITGHEAI